MIIGIDGNEANVKNRVGSGQYAYELLEEFAKDKNHHFIIYLKDKPFFDLPKESANFTYKVFGPKKLWTQIALPLKLVMDSKIDVFFSMAHYGPRFSKVPYVVTIHDLSYLHFPEMFRKNDLYQLVNWTKYSIKNSSHVIAVSKSTKDDITRNYHVLPSKITVTYEGYNRSRFKPQPKSKYKSTKSKYKIKDDYLIFVGTLQPRKNLERLIEAFHQVIRQSGHQTIRSSDNQEELFRHFDNLSLVIAGKKGWLYDQIFDKVERLGLESNVVFTDYVPDDYLPSLISFAKAYVLPSLWEGFGIPVIEAQACGVPVIVSNTSSLPEVVGESGILIDPTDVKSIASGIRLALDQKTRKEFVKRGFENVKRFSWQKCAEETLEVLLKVASGRFLQPV